MGLRSFEGSISEPDVISESEGAEESESERDDSWGLGGSSSCESDELVEVDEGFPFSESLDVLDSLEGAFLGGGFSSMSDTGMSMGLPCWSHHEAGQASSGTSTHVSVPDNLA